MGDSFVGEDVNDGLGEAELGPVGVGGGEEGFVGVVLFFFLDFRMMVM